jgi:hypothetical protein
VFILHFQCPVKNERTFVLDVTYYVFYDFMFASFSLQVL